MSKFMGLAILIKSVQAEYKQLVAQGETKATKQIETMVGAGIWLSLIHISEPTRPY